jgi:hypothetical protein
MQMPEAVYFSNPEGHISTIDTLFRTSLPPDHPLHPRLQQQFFDAGIRDEPKYGDVAGEFHTRIMQGIQSPGTTARPFGFPAIATDGTLVSIAQIGDHIHLVASYLDSGAIYVESTDQGNLGVLERTDRRVFCDSRALGACVLAHELAKPAKLSYIYIHRHVDVSEVDYGAANPEASKPIIGAMAGGDTKPLPLFAIRSFVNIL